MTTLPDYEAFARAYLAGEAEVAVTTLVADLETPVSAYLKLARGRAGNMFLLESVEGGAQRGRYSMIGLDPDLIFRSSGDRAEINRRALVDPDAFVPCPGDPLDALRALLAELRIEMPPGLPPMSAGVFGYLGYDMVRRMERLAPAKPDPIGVPETLLIRPTVMVVFDGARDEMSVVTPVRPAAGVSARAAYESAMARLDAVVDALESPLDHTTAMAVDPFVKAGEARSNTTEAEYMAMVARAKDYIAAGDAFQIVLSQRFTSRFDLPAFALYRALRRVNPSPYLCFLDFGGFQIVCSSPEILVRVRDGKVVIRPIAGTRPRGKSPTEDDALAAELMADPKERAEHLMLLDLGRNDVGRVAKIGTVKVTDSFFIERYSHVMHIVSNVEGDLARRRRCGRRAGRWLSRRHRLRRAESPRDADHRRTGEGQARHLRRLHRLFRRRRRNGHLHRAARLGGEGRPDACPGRRRHRLRFLARRRAEGMRRQGARPVPRRGRGGPIRGSGQARAVSATPFSLREKAAGHRASGRTPVLPDELLACRMRETFTQPLSRRSFGIHTSDLPWAIA